METKEMAPRHANDSLTRLPVLASPLLQFDLEKEVQELRSTESWNRATGRSSKTLAKHASFRIVLVAMKAATRMKPHHALGRISLQSIQGRACAHLGDHDIALHPGSLIIVDTGVLSGIEAVEECALLLTISWPDELSADESQEHALDEEAGLRMSDEGGQGIPD